MSLRAAIEELARVDAGTAVTLSVHSMICNAIAKLGSEEQRERWLAELARRHDRRLRAHRARRGFRRRRDCARAVRDGDTYVLNGRKQWCTNGGYAAVVMAMFRTGEAGPKGISAFLVDTSLPGVIVER